MYAKQRDVKKKTSSRYRLSVHEPAIPESLLQPLVLLDLLDVRHVNAPLHVLLGVLGALALYLALHCRLNAREDAISSVASGEDDIDDDEGPSGLEAGKQNG